MSIRFGAGTRRWRTRAVITQIVNVPPESPAFVTTRQPYEDLAVGTPFGKFTAVDRNGDALTWTLTSNASGRVSISSDGTVYVASALDYETQNKTLSFVGKGSDPLGAFVTLSVNLDIVDVFEAPLPTPPKVTLSALTLNEGSPAGTVIGNVLINDPDVGETYTVELIDNALNRVALLDQARQIVAGSSPARYQDGNFVIKIRVTDSNGLSSGDVPFTIQVQNVNEAPNTPTVESAFVSESQPIHVAFSKILVSDPDPNDTLVVTVTSDPDNKFEVLQVSGGWGLALKAAVNYATKTQHTVGLTVTDAAGLSASLNTTIDVRPATVQAGKIAGPTFFMVGQWIAEPGDDANLKSRGVNTAFHRSSTSPLTEAQWVAGHKANGMKYVLSPANATAYANDADVVAFLQANKPTSGPAPLATQKTTWAGQLPAGQNVPAVVNLDGDQLTSLRGYSDAALYDYVEGIESDWIGSESYPEAYGRAITRAEPIGASWTTEQGFAVDTIKRWSPNKAVLQSVQASDFLANSTPTAGAFRAQLWSSVIHGVSGVMLYDIAASAGMALEMQTQFALLKQIEGILLDTRNGGAKSATLYRSAYPDAWAKTPTETASTWNALVPFPVPGKDTAPAGSSWGRPNAIGASYAATAGVTAMPAGATLSGNLITVTGNDVVFNNWDMRNYRIVVQGLRCRITNCDFNHGGTPPYGSYANRDFPPVVEFQTGADWFVCKNNTFNGQKVKPGASMAIIMRARGIVGWNRIEFMPSDGILLANGSGGIIEWNYYENNGYNDGVHLDGIEFIGCSYPVVIRRNYIYCWRPADVTDANFSASPSDPKYQTGINAAIKLYEELGNVFNANSIICENVLRGGGLTIMSFADANGAFTGPGHHEIFDNWFGDDSKFGPNCWITSTQAGQPETPKQDHVYRNRRLTANSAGPAGAYLYEKWASASGYKGVLDPMGPQLPYPFEGRVISTSQGAFYVILNLSNASATLTYAPLGLSGITFSAYEVKTGTTITSAPPANDTIPDDFSTPNLTEQALNTVISSPLVKITGINAATPVALSGTGEYRIVATDGVTEVKTWGTTAGSVLVNQYVQRRMTTPNSNAATVSQNLDIGGVSRSWSVTTLVGNVTSVPLYKQSGWNALIPWQVAGKDFTVGLTTPKANYAKIATTAIPGISKSGDAGTITQSGTYENIDLTGLASLTISADNVTLRNVYWLAPAVADYFIRHRTNRNLTIEYSDLDGGRIQNNCSPVIFNSGGGGTPEISDLYCYRTRIHGLASDGIHMMGGELYEVVIDDNPYGAGAHGDCVEQIGSYIRTAIWRCTLICGEGSGGQDAAIKNWNELGGVFKQPMVYEENFLQGGLYILRQGTTQAAGAAGWRTSINNRFGYVQQNAPYSGGPFSSDPDPNLSHMEGKYLFTDPKAQGSGPGVAVAEFNPGVRAATVNDLVLTNPAGTLNVHGVFTTRSTGRGFDEFRWRLVGSERWSWSNRCPQRGILDFTVPAPGRYEVIVRGYNDQNGVVIPGNWNPTYFYITVGPQATPSTPGGISDLAVVGTPLATQATLNFTPGANSPNFEARLNGGTVFGVTPTVVNGKQQFDVGSLTASTSYTAEVRGTNGGVPGPWSNAITFTTQATGGGGGGGTGGGGGGGTTEHSATTAFVTAVEAANGTTYPTGFRSALDTFIKALDVSTNGVWPFLVDGYLCLNDNANAARRGIKTAAHVLVDFAGEGPTFSRKVGLVNGKAKTGILLSQATGFQYTLAGVVLGNNPGSDGAVWVGGIEGGLALGNHRTSGTLDGFTLRDATSSVSVATGLVPPDDALLGVSTAQGAAIQTIRSNASKGTFTAGGAAAALDTTQEMALGGYNPWGAGNGTKRCWFLFNKALTDAEWSVLYNAWAAYVTAVAGLA